MRKIFSLFLALVLAILPVSTVFADNIPDTINISVKKYMYVGEEKLDNIITNNGAEMNINDSRLSIYNKEKYGRIAFSLYKIEDLTKVPEDKTTQQVAFDIQDAVFNNKELPYGASLVKKDVDVDDNGEALFTDVINNKGYGYILVETVSSEAVKQIANPMFIRLPMANPSGEGYINDTVFLYPKNNVQLLELDFNKLKQSNTDKHPIALKGAKFKLYIGEPGKGEPIKESSQSNNDLILTTNNEGKISIPGLIPGKFYLVEQEVPELLDGKLLIGGDARNDEYNKLYFEVSSNRKIETSSVFNNYVNYTQPELEKKLTNEKDSYSIYDRINFEINLSLPKNIKDYSKLYVEDKLLLDGKATSDVQYVYDTLSVTADGNKLEENKDFTISKSNNQFKIDFIMNDKVSDTVMKSENIKVTYEAEFLADVTPNGDYKNKAVVTFNNSPNKNNEDKTDEDKTKKFTSYGFIIQKTNDGLWRTSVSPEGLKGAKFILLDSEGNVYKGPDKKVLFGRKDSDDYVLESGNDGIIKVNGLKEGTYTLREIEAPKGFKLPSGSDAETKISVNSSSHLERNTIHIKNVRQEFVMTGREEALTTVGILALALSGLIAAYAVVSKKKRKKIA